MLECFLSGPAHAVAAVAAAAVAHAGSGPAHAVAIWFQPGGGRGASGSCTAVAHAGSGPAHAVAIWFQLGGSRGASGGCAQSDRRRGACWAALLPPWFLERMLCTRGACSLELALSMRDSMRMLWRMFRLLEQVCEQAAGTLLQHLRWLHCCSTCGGYVAVHVGVLLYL